MSVERELISRFPTIAWREPVAVSSFEGGATHYACRFCICINGLRGAEVPNLPTDHDSVRQHIETVHLAAVNREGAPGGH